MTGPIYKRQEWWKHVHIPSILPCFWNISNLALLTLQSFEIHTGNTTEARHSCTECKSISTPLGYSSKGFLGFNNHQKMYCYYWQLYLDHCLEKSKQHSPLIRGYTRRICIEELVILPLQDNETLCQAAIKVPFGQTLSSQATINNLFQQHKVACYHQCTVLQIFFQTLKCGYVLWAKVQYQGNKPASGNKKKKKSPI